MTMKYLHVNANVERRIEHLKQTGKAGRSLAQKANRIIRRLTSGEIRHLWDGTGRCTKHGENRIRHCRKYDLGCGYRLITLKRGLRVHIPFLGTHDECRRWLANNSRLKQIPASNGTMFRIPSDVRAKADPGGKAGVDSTCDARDDEVVRKLDDRDLRRIFSGLVNGSEQSENRATIFKEIRRKP